MVLVTAVYEGVAALGVPPPSPNMNMYESSATPMYGLTDTLQHTMNVRHGAVTQAPAVMTEPLARSRVAPGVVDRGDSVPPLVRPLTPLLSVYARKSTAVALAFATTVVRTDSPGRRRGCPR